MGCCEPGVCAAQSIGNHKCRRESTLSSASSDCTEMADERTSALGLRKDSSLSTLSLSSTLSDNESQCSTSKKGPRVGNPKGRASSARFSCNEQAVLVGVIKADPELLRSFLHQARTRPYDKRSWMHEIATRFNQKSQTKRTLDAVRHHFMLRKSKSSGISGLIWHAIQCKRREECSKCLLLDRFRVESGLATCGVKECITCAQTDKSLPAAALPFNAQELLSQIQSSGTLSAPSAVNSSRDASSLKTKTEARKSQQWLQSPSLSVSARDLELAVAQVEQQSNAFLASIGLKNCLSPIAQRPFTPTLNSSGLMQNFISPRNSSMTESLGPISKQLNFLSQLQAMNVMPTLPTSSPNPTLWSSAASSITLPSLKASQPLGLKRKRTEADISCFGQSGAFHSPKRPALDQKAAEALRRFLS